MNNEKKMNQLKEEYMNVQIPEEGLKRLEQTIRCAKKDKRRVKKIHFFRNLAAGAAAMFAGVVVMVNVNADFAYAMEKIPVIGGVIKVITQERFQMEEGTVSADIRAPKVQSEENTAGIDKINKAVQKDKEELLALCSEMFETDAANENDEHKSVGLTEHYDIKADYEIVTDNDDYFVLRFWTVMTSASAQQVEKYYTIDRKTGDMLELKDLFKKDSDYVTAISENIKEQMKQQMAEDGEVYYWLDDPEMLAGNFEKIKKDQNFYINDKGNLVIVFDEYEVAPGYMGIVDFEIPREAVQSILK